MSDVFISYAREDLALAKKLALEFQEQGWSVWWDHTLLGGEEFGRVIEEELRQAACVVVLWSKTSVERPWVRSEADRALERRVLVPVLVERVTLPMPFDQIHTVPLEGWQGGADHEGLQKLLESVAGMLGSEVQPSDLTPPSFWKQKIVWGAAATVGVAAVALVPFLHEGSTVTIPGGEFVMGSSNRNANLAFDQAIKLRPRLDSAVTVSEIGEHRVLVDTFVIDRREVTVADYRSYLQKNNMGVEENDGQVDDKHPRVLVTWEEAKQYCESLDKTLPTEAQWEMAARRGHGGQYPWGPELPDQSRSNYCDRECDRGWADMSANDGFRLLAPVGKYEAGRSHDGVDDLAGNAAEWVIDWYDPSYYHNCCPEEITEHPVNRHEGQMRVIRGGHFRSDSWELRTTYRGALDPNVRSPEVGFRCVDPDP